MRIPRKRHTGVDPKARRPARRTWHGHVTVAVIVLVLLTTTVLLSLFGLEDFAHALTFPGRVTGAVLIVVSGTTLLAAAAVVDHWVGRCFPYSGLVALIGVFAALLTNALLLAEILKEGESLVYPLLFGTLTAGSVWAVFAVWRASVTVPAPKRVAVAVIVPTVIAVGNFGYQTLYLPYQRQTQPVISLSMGKAVLSEDRKAFTVPVDITLQNHSDVGFYVLGTEFHAMGQRVKLSPKDRGQQQWRADAEQWSRSVEINPLARKAVHQPGEMLEAKPWMPFGQWIEASDTFTTRLELHLPINTKYDQVALYTTASLARKDRLVMEPPLQFVASSWKMPHAPDWVKTQEKGGLDSLIYQARVHENNAIDERTRKARFVNVLWVFGEHGTSLVTSVAPRGAEGRALSPSQATDMLNRYGLVDLMAGPYERNLWDIKNQR